VEKMKKQDNWLHKNAIGSVEEGCPGGAVKRDPTAEGVGLLNYQQNIARLKAYERLITFYSSVSQNQMRFDE
jgi:hypothetical protein